MPVSMILDTDIGTDVDDTLALAFCLRHPELDLRAVTTVSGDTVRRAKIAAKVLRIAGRADIEVAAGERGEQSQPHRSPEGGHEGAMLGEGGDAVEIAERDGVSLLLEECAEHRYAVATIGMQSNIAAALRRDPSFADDIGGLTVMGGVFGPVRFLDNPLPPSVDHNLNVDQRASLVALNAGIDALYVGCEVTFTTWLTATHLDALRKGDALCHELVRQIEVWTPQMHRGGRGVIPPEYVALLHDPLAVACMTDEGRRFVTIERLPVTVAMHQGHVRTFIDPAAGHEVEVVRSVRMPDFADFWLETVLG